MATVVASTTTATPAQIVANVANNPEVGGAISVPDSEWSQLASFFHFDATKIDAFNPLAGPYAGKSFVKASQIVQPGVGAAADAGANVAGSAATSALDATGLSQIWSALTNPSNWLRALEILGAVVAIYMGLRSLTGAPGVIETAEKVKP